MAILLLFPITWLTQGISILASFVMLLAWLLSRLAVLGSMLDFVPWLICAMVLLGVLPASIAYRQGRRFVQWWFYGTVNFAAALSKAATLTTLENPHGTLRKCPTCREWIQAEAVECGYCGAEVRPLTREEQKARRRTAQKLVRRTDKLPRWTGG